MVTAGGVGGWKAHIVVHRLETGVVGPQGVVGVADKIFDAEFPVGVNIIFNTAAKKFGAAIFLVEHDVQIPAKITEKLLQRRRFLVEGGKNQSFIAIHPRLLEPPFAFVDISFVVNVFIGQAEQIPRRAESPAVVITGEVAGIAIVGKANFIAAMGAGVEKHPHAAISLAGHNHSVLADIGGVEIVGVGNHRIVSHKLPGFGENLLQFPLVNLLFPENTAIYPALFNIDVLVMIVGIGRYRIHYDLPPGLPFLAAVP